MEATEQLKITKQPSLTTILAYMIQLLSVVWFLSALTSAVQVEKTAREELAVRVKENEKKLYRVDTLSDAIARIESDITEIKGDVKDLTRRQFPGPRS